MASAADTQNMTREEKEEAQERGKAGRAFTKDTLMPDNSVNVAGLLVAARIALETDSLRVAKEMLTVLLARELEGMTGTPDRVALTRWDAKVADRFLRKGNKRRTIGFGAPSTPVVV